MKTDRELLELAAKAAGIKHVDYSGINYDPHFGIMTTDEFGRHSGTWSPLTDDGDALRLAVTLELDILRFPAFGEVQVCSQNGVADEAESTGLCAISATRRAIVRAAAAIGEAMP